MSQGVRHAEPVLPVPDVEEALAWYESALGATDAWRWGDPVVHGGCRLGSQSVQFAKRDGGPSGISLWCLVPRLEAYREGGTFRIRDVIVRPEFQGRGVGTRLLGAIHDWAAAELVPDAWLQLHTGHATVGFYERLGYDGGGPHLALLQRPASAVRPKA